MKMNRRNFGAAGLAVATAPLAGCLDMAGEPAEPRLLAYDGPPVTSIAVAKGERRMQLLNGDQELRSYGLSLGFDPVGDKRQEGDGRTPEGSYRIDRRNPNSAFHLSLGISYPNSEDVARARAEGVDPGRDIFIHGQPNGIPPIARLWRRDWTAGCIAVSNAEIEEIFAMVQIGTPIEISA